MADVAAVAIMLFALIWVANIVLSIIPDRKRERAHQALQRRRRVEKLEHELEVMRGRYRYDIEWMRALGHSPSCTTCASFGVWRSESSSVTSAAQKGSVTSSRTPATRTSRTSARNMVSRSSRR